MKKVVYTKIGGPNSIEIHDFEPVELKHDEVRVRIFRAGINFADLMMRQGLYGSNPDFPFTPGYEVSGEIIELGEGVERLEVGQRVIVMTGFGGYSEQVVASTNRVIPIPDSISYDAAATLGVTYGTAYHMLVHLGNMRKGESVLIHHAAGGVGTAAVQICQALGVTNIIGTASSSKREFVESLGMRFVDRDAEDFVMVCKDMTNGKGVHHAIDPVGGKHLMRSYKALRNGGKLYCFGASAAVTGPKRNYFSAFKMWRSTPKFNPLIMMNSNKAIFGVHMGRMDESTVFESHMMDLAKMLQQGKIDPIIDSVWRFEKVADAQQHMHDRKNRGKVLLDFS
ncbi:MAG: zinc-binding dehydrogenase [Euryarchaeota archaeon]|jgi:NADPH:quinone reductase-like Zn-dependent oxidoreductase|nr:zinc-binding dehydrogenase [Euryarchaeota archaeon]MBT3653899.1 zinc-binding dehydrogenase [Euryarchaeota archaeon]MBT3757303.1 zinc-binding dehydrogenase [Euryarchaeota archaeon]MBT4346192.1 zinc-binding dehydrogenase [Euryarchaeota archaeon]MBT4650336.1 zinc-binding dehydrogenase [Euryarchaeota archaeon]|tara:strand:+ start:4023 stop:5039 length:1017 start_codon:yes stop_codon:yes gene_type:complete